jgi:hypothetical protein
MEGEIGTRTTYGINFQFIKIFFLEKQNEEMNQETKTKLQISAKIHERAVCEMETGLKWFRICRRGRSFIER